MQSPFAYIHAVTNTRVAIYDERRRRSKNLYIQLLLSSLRPAWRCGASEKVPHLYASHLTAREAVLVIQERADHLRSGNRLGDAAWAPSLARSSSSMGPVSK